MAERKQSGWACPKCSKVYSPKIEECKDCNEGIQKTIPYVPYIPYIPYVPDTPQRPWYVPYYPWTEPWIIRDDSTAGTAAPPDNWQIICT